MTRRRAETGFTLLEVMVALTIFAICAAVLLQQSGRATQQAAQLEDHLLALWLAENQLELLRLSGEFPALGQRQQQLPYARRQWTVSQTVSATSNPDLRRVTINVQRSSGANSEGGNPNGSTQLVTFVGRH